MTDGILRSQLGSRAYSLGPKTFGITVKIFEIENLCELGD